jgi:hypothetical protein
MLFEKTVINQRASKGLSRGSIEQNRVFIFSPFQAMVCACLGVFELL